MDSEFGYFAIDKREFFQSLKLPVDVFVKISEKKFICISKKGDKLSLESLHVSQHASLQWLYVREEEYKKFLEFNFEMSARVLKTPGLNLGQSLPFYSVAFSNLFNNIESAGMNQEMLYSSKEMAQSVVKLVDRRPNVSKLVSGLEQLGPQFVQETLLTMVLSVAIGQMLEINRERLNILALAALLHDVGLREIPSDILSKNRADMTQAERALYETHPFRGAEMIRLADRQCPPEVIQVALQHHETSNGQGYPNQLDELKMHPFARIVSLADWISDYVVGFSAQTEKRSFSEALIALETLGVPYSGNIFKCLKNLEKADQQRAA